MKKIKKFSLLLAIIFIFGTVISFSGFAHDDIKPIEDNDKIYATIPWDYELSVYTKNLSYEDDEGNLLQFCLGENKFAPEGILSLTPEKVQIVFEHFYLNEGELERINDCVVEYNTTKKDKVNGYSCYYIAGKYAYEESEFDGFFTYYFNAYVFATKEDIFIVGYEDIEGETKYPEDLFSTVYGIVFNGTHFKKDVPERNSDHDFSNSPAFDDVVASVQEDVFGDIFKDESIVGIVVTVIALFTIVPTLILIIVAVVLIRKYNKVKKTLKQYELSYGRISQSNAYPQSFSGYGYNQPVNQPYQPSVNPAYQQNTVNQNIPQTPSYVTNAVNSLERTQNTQPAQNNFPSEMQELQKNNENKF